MAIYIVRVFISSNAKGRPSRRPPHVRESVRTHSGSSPTGPQKATKQGNSRGLLLASAFSNLRRPSDTPYTVPHNKPTLSRHRVYSLEHCCLRSIASPIFRPSPIKAHAPPEPPTAAPAPLPKCLPAAGAAPATHTRLPAPVLLAPRTSAAISRKQSALKSCSQSWGVSFSPQRSLPPARSRCRVPGSLASRHRRNALHCPESMFPSCISGSPGRSFSSMRRS